MHDKMGRQVSVALDVAASSLTLQGVQACPVKQLHLWQIGVAAQSTYLVLAADQ